MIRATALSAPLLNVSICKSALIERTDWKNDSQADCCAGVIAGYTRFN